MVCEEGGVEVIRVELRLLGIIRVELWLLGIIRVELRLLGIIRGGVEVIRHYWLD